MSKNPSWIADELILALDLYFKVNVIKTSAQHPLIVNLSKLLRSLPLHDLGNVGENFRSPSSVYMKLSNFLRIDPTYSGRGLDAGSKLDIEIWNEYSGDLDRLRKIANAIYHNINAPNSHLEEKIFTGEDEESVFLEGKIISRLHKKRERNSSLVRRKKRIVFMETGALICEICGFDFAKVYGKYGEGFAECHHNVPLSEFRYEKPVKISDLAIICANCHRIIHRVNPMPSITQFKEKIISGKKDNH